METVQIDNDAKARILEIAEENDGKITPEMVIADAKRKASPLHACFVWDLKAAAHQNWLERARTLIRSVMVVTTTQTVEVRSHAFVRDPQSGPREQGMVTVSRLRSERDLAIEALTAEFSRVAAVLRRARNIAVALGLESEVEALFGQLELATEKVREAA